jgi:UDP-N-acetylmuramoyl-tripeptide--D-alanyl-D-alanine ligase
VTGARLTLAEVVDATGGRLLGEAAPSMPLRRVEPDLGRIGRGDLFVALPGERIDGHDLVPVAALKGAGAALVAERWAARVEELALPLVAVDDPASALQELAAARRRALRALVVGVTGSVGKTTTKEAIAAVLARRFRVYRNPGNRNNEIGLPLALLEVDDAAEVAVLELGGAHAPGEIELLARIAQPAVAVVTNVFGVHLERMGSLDAIARTKGDLVAALPQDGTAVLHGDDERVAAMAARTRARVVTYGSGAASDVRAVDVRLRGLHGCSFTVELDGRRTAAEVPLVGGHAVEVALAALAVGNVLGLAVEDMLPALADPAIQLHLRRLRGVGGSLLLDDSYNASPPSMRSALNLLASARDRRRIAVLGDMRELGESAEREHRAVGRQAAACADLVVTYGELARAIADEARRTGSGSLTVVSFAENERAELVALLRAELREGDVALIKGSRSLRLDEVSDALTRSEPF